MNSRPSRNPDRRLTAESVDALLRFEAGAEVEQGTGRVAARVRAQMTHAAPAMAQTTGRWQGFASLVAACLIVVVTWFVIGTQTPLPLRERGAIVRLTSALDHSAAAIRGAKPEQAIVTEVRRLRGEVERGVGFVKAVLPRVRSNG